MKRISAPRARNLSLYIATVVLNGSISLISIPIVVAIAGAGPWASMATGQSIGASFGVLVIFGWGLTGPASVARTAAAGRPALFLDSLLARGALLLPVLVIQALVTISIVPHAKFIAVTAGFAMTLAGASANWYFTGESRPDRFLLLDTLPRVAGTVVGLLLVMATGDLLFFALSQLLGAVVALLASAWVILHGKLLDYRAALSWRRIVRNLVEQRHGVVATGMYAAFGPAVLGIVAVASPGLLPNFVLADRIGKFIGMAVSPVNLVFQGWVPSATGRELVRRIRVSSWVTVGITIAVIAGYAIALPWFSDILTHGQVTFDPAMALAFALIAGSWIVTPFMSNVALMAVRRLRVIAYTVAVGVPTSLVLLVVIELARGAEFAVWAIVAGNALILGWQVIALRRAVRTLDHDPAAPVTAPVSIPVH